jgi:hypothetical protein
MLPGVVDRSSDSAAKLSNNWGDRLMVVLEILPSDIGKRERVEIVTFDISTFRWRTPQYYWTHSFCLRLTPVPQGAVRGASEPRSQG